MRGPSLNLPAPPSGGRCDIAGGVAAYEARTLRDENLREYYARVAMASVGRLLGAVDRNPYHATYGCFDRQFWHYRTASFPSEMYQEAVLPLALAYRYALPVNQWCGNARVRELVLAGLRFSAERGRRDGSCDDYYPFERALGAAVFSLQASARAYQLLELDDAGIVLGLVRRAEWILRNDESGRLANHHALAALALERLAQITGDDRYDRAAAERAQRVVGWQSSEGWFEEYGGADPGYQTVTVDCLAQYQRATGATWLDEPLRKATAFARWFLHRDGSYGGEYGSRGTYHFYPHGFELLAGDDANAADLADGFLQSLAADTAAHFADDRMFVHRLASLIDAYLDWAPERPRTNVDESTEATRWFPEAGLFVRCGREHHTIVSTARGGVFKHHAHDQAPTTDAGLIVETTDGRVAVSQSHHYDRHVQYARDDDHAGNDDPSNPGTAALRLEVSGPLDYVRHETANPLSMAVLHVGMWILGRWCRTLVRRLLQRRLITGRRACPIRLTRRFCIPLHVADEVSDEAGVRSDGGRHVSGLQVVDEIELTDPRIHVQRMHFGTDHQSAYVAASGVYQAAVLEPWVDLSQHVESLNRARRITIVRNL